MKAMMAESNKAGSFLMGHQIEQKRYFFCFTLFVLLNTNCVAQKSDIGMFYGKFYALYKSVDYGTGFRNTPKSQYSGYPTISISKQFTKRWSGEISTSFLAYQQYIGTRLYFPNFYSVYYAGNIAVTANVSVFRVASKFETRIKGGIGFGVVPDMYQGRFTEIFWDQSIDSISRGNIKRDFAPLFPTICLGLDFSYKIARRFKVSLAGAYQKGFLRITEYDVYYNDGSGKNDQRAKQWGTGDFYGVQLGLKYLLKVDNESNGSRKR